MRLTEADLHVRLQHDIILVLTRAKRYLRYWHEFTLPWSSFPTFMQRQACPAQLQSVSLRKRPGRPAGHADEGPRRKSTGDHPKLPPRAALALTEPHPARHPMPELQRNRLSQYQARAVVAKRLRLGARPGGQSTAMWSVASRRNPFSPRPASLSAGAARNRLGAARGRVLSGLLRSFRQTFRERDHQTILK